MGQRPSPVGVTRSRWQKRDSLEGIRCLDSELWGLVTSFLTTSRAVTPGLARFSCQSGQLETSRLTRGP